ncbi:chromosome segregation DNA-binding protein [Tistlia consotensis]|uniref:Chromosome segregation DNA-binding protein n=1 Tax=Tistlia consotensis USBA 355 TaxID=560819 RepID=A0A1Y6BN16_9PROT|nr:ParB/RepB/Spo0J family partition protein [Tistlia consotensis]SMF09112.1 chromosome segregation DNA-binding protein [Tistlia consotensis USBA 355]SNR34839.1 chromosome segregation DNA-binding protein [Tistlia consotensis]
MSDSETPRRSNLGRGLAALLGEDSEDYASLDRMRAAKEVPIERLHPSRVQPRRTFSEEALESLAESIRAQGLLQPILVRRHPDQANDYEIIAGERRWRAAQRAQLHQVPVIIREFTDGQALEAALVENVQRQDLDPVEEAEGYRRLIDDFGHSQDDLAKLIGKSRPHIANTLRLLNLPEPVRQKLRERALTAGHARALLAASDPEALAERVLARGLSVRETERLAGEEPKAPRAGRPPRVSAPSKDADTLAIERDLAQVLGLKVSIDLKDGERGTITIHYDTLDQLDDVLKRLNKAGNLGAA